MTSYELRLGDFQGPISLLLSLVEKKKLPISDLSLAKITDDYIRFIRENEDEIDMHDISQFLSVVSTLVLIKSRELIPSFPLEDEEVEDIEELKRRLQVLDLFRKFSLRLSRIYRSDPSYYFPKERRREVKISFSPAENVNLKEMLVAIQSILSELEGEEKVKRKKRAFVRIHIHIGEIIEKILVRMRSTSEALKLNEVVEDFSSLYSDRLHSHRDRRILKLVTFLAGLELSKQGELSLKQEQTFSEISFYPYNEKDSPSL